MLVLIRSKTNTALLVSFHIVKFPLPAKDTNGTLLVSFLKMQNLALTPDFYFVLFQFMNEKPTIPAKCINPKTEKIIIMKTKKSMTKLKRFLLM